MRQDKYGRNCDILLRKKLFLLDMDGTVYQENRLFDGTLPFLEAIERQGGRYVFITNNSSRSLEDYIRKVNGMGIRADADNFFTSVQATVLLLQERYPGVKVFCVGTRSMLSELRAAGIAVTEEPDEDIGLLLLGFDTELTGRKLRNLSELLTTRDLPYYATNPDLVCPVSFGYIPDCGSYSMMLKNATGKYPVFIGKPEPTMIDIVRRKFGCSAEETLVVGDRIYTDIKSGRNAGVSTALVLSGEATEQTLRESPDKPEFVFDSVADILPPDM